ncbi:trna 5-methylaminomethyl-2-thiouridylate -methyltransferase [Holotrichia oblita]|nr:trna 5-methylaminomethyl-2-thiouridylate -methyltransferase [Holotrichia oblita]
MPETENIKNKTVVVGMSGGVDSSVAAALLKRQGFNVVGLFMKNWDEKDENGQCTSAADWEDALQVCGTLDIPCYSVNFSDEYMQRVFAYFLDEYKKGRTPNPDVLCNREIKFGPFKEFAMGLGADYIATGHYCGLRRENSANLLIKAVDAAKDQTYFLNQVRTEQLDNVIFPLSGLNKSEVRRIADSINLPTAKKKDSTGICFIGERKFKNFLANYLPAQQGEIRDTGGSKVGSHSGLMYYTLGQRRGLGIGGVKDEKSGRWYVVDKDLTTNTLIVSCGGGEELLSRSLTASSFNFIGTKMPQEFECFAKFRYRQDEQRVRVSQKGEIVAIEFEKRQRAVTPGQYAVLYLGDRCLGGGVIDLVIK